MAEQGQGVDQPRVRASVGDDYDLAAAALETVAAA
jgi:hypothetical protein